MDFLQQKIKRTKGSEWKTEASKQKAVAKTAVQLGDAHDGQKGKIITMMTFSDFMKKAKQLEKEYSKVPNTIKREHHFESDGQAYTAWITVDTDMKTVYRPEELPEYSDVPDAELPPIIIKNDGNPDECYEINFYDDGISIDGYSGLLEAEDFQLRDISFDGRNNTLTFRFCMDADDDEQEDEDDDEYELLEMPCDKRLAAFIIKYWNLHGRVESIFYDNNEFVGTLSMGTLFSIKDFVIED